MLFQNTDDHPHIAMLDCGDKTETRRGSKRWQMKVGGIYAAHDASKGLFQQKADAPVLIKCLARYEEPLWQIDKIDACKEGRIIAEEQEYTFKTDSEQYDVLSILIHDLKETEAGHLQIEMEKDGCKTSVSVEHWWRADAEKSGIDIFTVSVSTEELV